MKSTPTTSYPKKVHMLSKQLMLNKKSIHSPKGLKARDVEQLVHKTRRIAPMAYISTHLRPHRYHFGFNKKPFSKAV